MDEIALSILTPAVPSRLNNESLVMLVSAIGGQIGRDLPVEHLVLLDNKRRTIGEKRDALLRASQGRYVAFVDDDDRIAPGYVQAILGAIQSAPDVVTFNQLATVNGVECEIEHGLGNQNESFPGNGRIKRAAWHTCAWRRELAILSHFPAVSYGEDWAFAEPLNRIAKTSVHIPSILHYYRHSTETTEAPSP